MRNTRLFLFLVLSLAVLPLVAVPRPIPQPYGGGSIINHIFAYGFIFQLAAIVTFAKRGGDRYWIWIIIIGGAIGALAYFLVEGMPDFAQIGRSFKGPARRRRIAVLRALILDNPSAGNYEQLGELLIEEKKWREARDAFDRALASRTDSLDPFYWRGVAAFELGDDAAAVSDLRHVVDKEPKYGYCAAMTLLAQSLARSGRTSEARTVFERLLQSTTAAQSVVAAAEFFIAEQRCAEARTMLEGVLARRATMPKYQKRRDARWIRKAKQLLRQARKLEAKPAGERAAA